MYSLEERSIFFVLSLGLGIDIKKVLTSLSKIEWQRDSSAVNSPTNLSLLNNPNLDYETRLKYGLWLTSDEYLSLY